MLSNVEKREEEETPTVVDRYRRLPAANLKDVLTIDPVRTRILSFLKTDFIGLFNLAEYVPENALCEVHDQLKKMNDDVTIGGDGKIFFDTFHYFYLKESLMCQDFFENVRKLTLDSIDFAKYPSDYFLRLLKNLVHLIICNISGEYVLNLRGYESIQTLELSSLSDLQILTLPNNLKKFIIKQCLEVNEIYNLPESLETLIIHECPLFVITLSHKWTVCKNLRHLEVTACDLNDMGEELLKNMEIIVPDLRRLVYSYNGEGNYLDFRGFDSLEEIDCRFNELDAIDLPTSRMEKINASGNFLTKAPEGLRRMNRLRNLDLSHNRLESYSDDFRLPWPLTIGNGDISVNLSFNPFLRRVDLTGSRIEDLDCRHCDIEHLQLGWNYKKVNCSFNNLRFLNLTTGPLLESLDCSGNDELDTVYIHQNARLDENKFRQMHSGVQLVRV